MSYVPYDLRLDLFYVICFMFLGNILDLEVDLHVTTPIYYYWCNSRSEWFDSNLVHNHWMQLDLTYLSEDCKERRHVWAWPIRRKIAKPSYICLSINEYWSYFVLFELLMFPSSIVAQLGWSPWVHSN